MNDLEFQRMNYKIANEIIRTPNCIQLEQLKVLGACLALVNEDDMDKEIVYVQMPLKTLMKCLDVKTKNLNYYKVLLKKMEFSAFIEIDNEDGHISEWTEVTENGWNSVKWLKMALFPVIKIDKKNIVTIGLGNTEYKIVRILKDNFTIIKNSLVAPFTSRYSMLLYWYLKSWTNKDQVNYRYMTTEDLLKFFKIGEDKYRRKDGQFARKPFENKTVELAIDEINKFTDLDVVWGKNKNGKFVLNYWFKWTVKGEYKPKKSLKQEMKETVYDENYYNTENNPVFDEEELKALMENRG